VLEHPEQYRGNQEDIRKMYKPDTIAAEYEGLFDRLLRKGRNA
jgi:hypothetical protein